MKVLVRFLNSKTTLFLIVLFLLNPSSSLAATVSILSSPDSISFDTPFSFQTKVIGDANVSYYLKARVGTSSAYLTKASTNNPTNTSPDDWLSDTDSWSKFPLGTTDNSGFWQGNITAKISASASLGSNLLILRIRKTASSTNIDSSSVSLTLTEPTPSPTPISVPTDIPTPTPFPIPTETPISTPTPPPVFSISASSTDFSASEEIFVSTQISGLSPNTQYFLKGAFIKEGGSNYFGLTKTGNNWIKNSQTFSSQYPITTDSSGNFSGSLELMADTDDAGFLGSGSYILKVRRYNQDGENPAWSNEILVNIQQEISPSPTFFVQPSLLPSLRETPPLQLSPHIILSSLSGKLSSDSPALKTKIPAFLLPGSSSVAGVSSEEVKASLENSFNLFTTAGVLIFLSGLIIFGFQLKKKFAPLP